MVGADVGWSPTGPGLENTVGEGVGWGQSTFNWASADNGNDRPESMGKGSDLG